MIPVSTHGKGTEGLISSTFYGSTVTRMQNLSFANDFWNMFEVIAALLHRKESHTHNDA